VRTALLVLVLGLVLVLCAACRVYDPVDEIPHREFATTQAAVAALLDDIGHPRVYAVGEYHPTRDLVGPATPIARFTRDILGLLEPRARHMVIEAWLDTRCAEPQRDVDQLVRAGSDRHIATHGLPVTCIEHSAMLDNRGHIDVLRLLELLTEKLHDTTRALVDDDLDVIVYGGALHNDLYPHWPLEQLSYAQPLAVELGGGGVVEIDLVVPEIVAPMASIRYEPWFPLLARAAPDRTTLWQRGPASYVLILPALTEAIAQIARPVPEDD